MAAGGQWRGPGKSFGAPSGLKASDGRGSLRPAGVPRFARTVVLRGKLQLAVPFRVTGMTNDQEVKIQPRGPDRGNPTSRRQGLCYGAPWLSRREVNVARPARGGLKEVIDAWRSRTQVKCRKAYPVDKLADGSEVQYLLEPVCVLATGSTRSSLVLPSEICRVSAKAVARRTKDERS